MQVKDIKQATHCMVGGAHSHVLDGETRRLSAAVWFCERCLKMALARARLGYIGWTVGVLSRGCTAPAISM